MIIQALRLCPAHGSQRDGKGLALVHEVNGMPVPMGAGSSSRLMPPANSRYVDALRSQGQV